MNNTTDLGNPESSTSNPELLAILLVSFLVLPTLLLIYLYKRNTAMAAHEDVAPSREPERFDEIQNASIVLYFRLVFRRVFLLFHLFLFIHDRGQLADSAAPSFALYADRDATGGWGPASGPTTAHILDVLPSTCRSFLFH